MTDPTSRRPIGAAGGLTGRQLDAEISREVARIREEIPPHMPTGKCRVCQHPDSRGKVNTLLGYGLGPTEILQYVEDINDKRSKNNKITLDSIRNHKQRHFNVQEISRSGYRRMLERRFKQLSDEQAHAVENLLTGMGYLDIVAHKGFQNLVDDTTIVDYETGLKAQLKLEEMLRDGAIEEQVAIMRREVAWLQQAVRETLKDHPQLQSELVSRLDELSGNVADDNIIDAEIIDDADEDDDDDVPFEPIIESDVEDLLED